MASSTTPHWEAPRFSFNVQIQEGEWKLFYTCAVNFLKALDIDPETEDRTKKGWRQIKIMFEGENQALQTLLDNNTITTEDQCTPIPALNAIQTIIKDDEHFWHYHNEFISDLRKHLDEDTYALNTEITTLINNYKFTHA